MMRSFIKFFICCLCLLPNLVSAQDQSGYATSITRDFVKPPYLKKGDTIMILAPAGRIKEKSSVDQGIELANHWGLVVFLGNHLFSQDNTFAGTVAGFEGCDGSRVGGAVCGRFWPRRRSSAELGQRSIGGRPAASRHRRAEVGESRRR